MRLLPLFMTIAVAIFASGCGTATQDLAKAKQAEAQAMQAAADVREAAEQKEAELAEVEDQAAEERPSNESGLVHEDLDATAWVQTSAEYPSITLQTYRAAQARLDKAIADPDWTAYAAQQDGLKDETGTVSYTHLTLPTILLV